MGSYENPRKKPIRTANRSIGAGITRMVKGLADDQIAQKEKKSRDDEEASKLLEQRHTKADKRFMTGYDNLTSDISNFGHSTLSKSNDNVFKDEINNLLDGKREEVEEWITNNPEASNIDIQSHINEGLEFQGLLRNNLAHLNVAREQYMAARDIEPGKEGSLVGNFNPELIKFFEAQDRNDPNMHMTLDENGGFRFTLADEAQIDEALGTMGENDLIEYTTFNMTDMFKKVDSGDIDYFKQVKPFDYTEMQGLIDGEIKNGNEGLGKKGKDGEIIYDQGAITEFLNGDGYGIVDSYTQDSDASGAWMSYGKNKMGDDGSYAYSNTVNNFDAKALGANIIDGFANQLPGKRISKNPSTPAPGKKVKEEVIEETVTEKDGKEESSVFSDMVEEGKAESLTESSVEFQPITMAEFNITEEEFMDGRMNLEDRFPGFEFKESGPGRDKISVKAPGATKFKEFSMGNNFQKGTNATGGINKYIEDNMKTNSSSSLKASKKVEDLIKKHS